MIILPTSTASLVNLLTIDMDCNCNFVKGVLGGWKLTPTSEKVIKFLMMNFCDGDMTINKLAWIIDRGDYVFGD